MKRTVVITGIFLTLLVLAMSSGSSAVTWHTYREDISMESGYADLDLVVSLGYTGSPTNASGNITLPCPIGNLSAMNFSVFANGDVLGYNLSVNTVELNGSALGNAGLVADGLTNWTSLAHYHAAGGENVTYIAWSFNASCTVGLNITIQGTDVTFNATWLANTSIFTVKEKDITIPTVGLTAASFWTVNDSFNVSSNLWIVNMSNVVFNITYPDHTVGTPSTETFNITSLAANGTNEQYVQYQKRGPYTYSIDSEVTGLIDLDEHEVKIYIRTEELLTNVVDWTIEPDEDFYEGYFDTVDVSLFIELNNVEQDYEFDGDNIVLEDFTTRDVYTLNKFVFTWTVAEELPAIVPGLSLISIVFFLPIWIWICISAVIIVAAVAIYIQYQK